MVFGGISHSWLCSPCLLPVRRSVYLPTYQFTSLILLSVSAYLLPAQLSVLYLMRASDRCGSSSYSLGALVPIFLARRIAYFLHTPTRRYFQLIDMDQAIPNLTNTHPVNLSHFESEKQVTRLSGGVNVHFSGFSPYPLQSFVCTREDVNRINRDTLRPTHWLTFSFTYQRHLAFGSTGV